MTISELLGKTLTKCQIVAGDDVARFYTDDGSVYELYHDQDCCESVSIEDVCGDPNDLVGSPLTMAEESTNDDPAKSQYDESWTWTFYRLATVKGYVTIRWYGSSNGYYSESVNFRKV